MILKYALRAIHSALPSSRSAGAAGGAVSTLRAPLDPLFYGNLTLQNFVPGSRYWIAQASDLSRVLATGVAGVSEVTISNIPAYANPMLVEIRVRKASSAPKYKPYVTYAYLVRAGVTAFIAQEIDPIA